MREILFKAKRINNGYWVEGDLSYHVHDGDVYVFPKDEYDSPDNYVVDPETVCQYTGLTDGNGRKIFEGDIFQADDGECLQKYAVVWNEDFLEWSAIGIDMDEQFSLSEFRVEKIDVIDNIFDNPELLETKAGRESRAEKAEPVHEREER